MIMKGNSINLILSFLIIIVIFTSGCAVSGIDYKESEDKEIADVVTIEKIETFPVSPVFSGRDFKLYVTLKNNDKKKPVDYVLAEIYDASVFTINGESSKAVGSMLPLGQVVVSFDLTAPDSERLANVETEGLVSVRVKYLFESDTTFDVIALNEDEITKHQQAGDSVKVLSSKLIGSGPIRIYPEMVGSDKNILIGTTKGSVAFTLKNEGTGFLEGGVIPTGFFSVEFPPELSISSDYSGSITGYSIATGMSTARTTTTKTTTTSTTIPIGVTTPTEESKIIFSQSGNTFTSTEKNIAVIGKESIPLIFYVSSPQVESQVTYTIHAKVKYVYEIRKDEKITIKPVAIP